MDLRSTGRGEAVPSWAFEPKAHAQLHISSTKCRPPNSSLSGDEEGKALGLRMGAMLIQTTKQRYLCWGLGLSTQNTSATSLRIDGLLNTPSKID